MLKRTLFALLLSTGLAIPAIAAGDVLDVAAPFEIKGADPTLSGDIFMKMDIAETLVNADTQGRLFPGLASSWTTSEDGLTWHFRIREGVGFHDGTQLTPEAVVNAIEKARAKKGLLSTVPVSAVKAEGPDLVITLLQPFGALPAFLAEYRSQILAPASYGPDGMATSVIGTGPFRITQIQPPMSLAAERHEGYWGEKAKIARVSYSAVGRAESRALMAESGDAEFVFNLDPASVQRLSAVESVDVHSVPIPRMLLLKVNAAHPFFDTTAER